LIVATGSAVALHEELEVASVTIVCEKIEVVDSSESAVKSNDVRMVKTAKDLYLSLHFSYLP
jgi:hypothetical protein